MEDEIKISVVIPTCDRPKYLKQAVNSVLAQTLTPLEIIIVNNGKAGVDLPEDILARVIIKNTAPLIGASAARNHGAGLAQGDYLAFLDDDDLWNKNYLANAAKSIRSGFLCVVGRLDKLQADKIFPYKNAQGALTVENLLTFNPGVNGSNLVIAKQIFLKVGGFDTQLPTSEDKSLIIELLKAGIKINVLADNQVLFRSDPDNSKLTEAKTMAVGIRRFVKKYNKLMNIKQRFYNWYKIFYYRHKSGIKSAILPYFFLTLFFAPKSFLNKVEKLTNVFMLDKIRFKVKSLFRKKNYVVLDGIELNATYTNRYFKNKENEGKKILEFLKSKAVKIETMVDVGANYGEISLYFAKNVPGSKIFGIEPSTRNLRVFNDNLGRQNFNVANIIIIKKAVSDKPGRIKMTKMIGEKNTIIDLKGRTEKVQADTLESIVKEANIGEIDFLKIDVEGAEFLLYESLKALIPRIKTILIEINGDARNIPLIQMLYSSGEIYLRSGDKWQGTAGELIDYFKKEQNDIWFINSHNDHKFL